MIIAIQECYVPMLYMHTKIPQTNITKTIWQTVRRITNEILGAKGLTCDETMLYPYNALHNYRITLPQHAPDPMTQQENMSYWEKNLAPT
ncbi:hypothetical protein pdam_00000354 [Pocillopora damicornis]|uniref:Uncharacterized protein n=1 Tax=Pocillopora damicornis TaxID=46731 RepID=A0A3M6UJ01_POCDA|nr:hypothetical protein pdam_00000354 [Pocillopora damicornis]